MPASALLGLWWCWVPRLLRFGHEHVVNEWRISSAFMLEDVALRFKLVNKSPNLADHAPTKCAITTQEVPAIDAMASCCAKQWQAKTSFVCRWWSSWSWPSFRCCTSCL